MTESDLARLAEPFDPKAVHWRIGSMDREGKRGIALAYIDARHVQERLDEVVGPESWCVSHRRVDNRNICTLSIRVAYADGTSEWVAKEDGAGDTAIEGEKGGLSDALKRAAVHWGIGRYLYRLDSPWVDVRNKRIADHEMAGLAAVLAGNAPPAKTPSAPRAAASTPPAPTEKPDEATQLVDKCFRIAKQRIDFLGVGKAESDADKYEEAKKLCAHLARQLGIAPEGTWTMEKARKLESRVKLWDPTRGKGEDFGDDPPINAEKNKALHALANEVRPNGDAHTIVHQAAEMLGIGSVADIPDSRYGDVWREINALVSPAP